MKRDSDLRKEFQAKFSGYRPTLPPDGWERIEQSLNQAALRRRTMRRRWYAEAAAVALVVLIGTLFYLNNPTIDPEVAVVAENGPEQSSAAPIMSQGSSTAPQSNLTMPQSRLNHSLTASVGRGADSHSVVRERSAEGGSPDRHLKHILLPAHLMNLLLDVRCPGESLQSRDALLAQMSRKRDVGILTGKEPEALSASDELLFADEDNLQSIDEQKIIGVNAKGGLSSYRQTVNPPMTLRSASRTSDFAMYDAKPVKSMIAPSRASESESEMEHDQPVSFGITFSKKLTPSVSLESGLSYVYLSSRLRNSSANFREQETQKIHYLGIPINLNYTIVSFNRLNLYASLGGMVEKDIYGEYRKLGEGENVAFSSSVEETEVTKISQRNPQLSVNAGLGLSYPLIDKLRLYGKIGGAYYFDAGNRYKTIYSDQKIVLDLNLGLRYEF